MNTVKEKVEVELLKDSVVKKIFSGDTESSRMLIASIIEEVTDKEYKKEDIVKNMVIENPYVSNSIKTVNSEVDTLLHTDDIEVNIEYNYYHSKNVDYKNNTYICKLILRQVRNSGEYSKMKKVIQINLNNYDLFKDKEFLHSSVYMDRKTKRIRPNNISEIYDINLALLRKIDYNKIEEGEYGELKKLLYFLVNNDKDILNSLYGRDKLMEDIKKKIEQVTNDLNYLFYYDKEELERKTQERMLREGREEGRTEGRAEGIKIGEEQKTIDMIKSMLENGASYDFVSKVTGKNIEEIKEIEKQ